MHIVPSDIINGDEGKYCASKTYRFLLISNWTETILQKVHYKADFNLCLLVTLNYPYP